MIHEVDEALRALVRTGPMARDIEVAFDAPTREWAARRNAPTVNLYLYDVREDLRRRQRGTVEEREGPVVTSRRPPARHIKLSYLLTAWTQRPEDEHRLLAELLSELLGRDALPSAGLGPQLAATGLPVPLSVALPPPEDRAFADVWTALGGELKPSLDVVVTAPMMVVAPVRTERPPHEGVVVDVESRRIPAGPDRPVRLDAPGVEVVAADRGVRRHRAPAADGTT
jgi:hypothetical protein